MRLQPVIDVISSILSSVTSNANATPAEDDSLEEIFADFALDEECRQPKRVKLDQTKFESIPSTVRSQGDPDVVGLTHHDENKPLGDRTPKYPRVQIKPSLSNVPRSMYENWTPPLAPTLEHIALDELLKGNDHSMASSGCDYITIPIRDFRIYRPSAAPGSTMKISRQHELEPLQNLQTHGRRDVLLADGIITHHGLNRYIQAVPFETLSIGGYTDPAIATVTQNIFIQSICAKTKNVWYILKEPASEYAPYHRPFLWIADLAKHFVDYLSEHDNVSLDHFKADFYHWTLQRHGQSQHFQRWLEEYSSRQKRNDFRQAVVCYADFLLKESSSILKNRFEHHQLWADIGFVTDEKMEEEPLQKTLVTPYVFQNFQNIAKLKRFLESREPTSRRVRADFEKRQRALGFSDAQLAQLHTSSGSFIRTTKLQIGDYVAINPEEASIWKDGSHLWYAYIQDIQQDRRGKLFSVIWMYSASATTLAGGVYPFPNELFLSDHCNCNESPLRMEHILGKVNISWLKSSAAPDDLNGATPHFFIRQQFNTKQHCFTTIKPSDFCCQCKSQDSLFEEILGKILIGDTILSPFNQKGKPSLRPLDSYGSGDEISDTLQPVIVEKYLPESRTILVRRLLRRNEFQEDSTAAPNELVWTDEFFETMPELVGPKCQVRFFEEGVQIPSPYNRNGSGNCWYVTNRLTSAGRLEKLEPPFPTGLNQGIDPNNPPPRPSMVGLDLFAGGGNFGRGLEEGMAVKLIYAIDWAKNAVLTYKANRSSEHPSWVYWGSVNNFLNRVMDGSTLNHFARIGEIDFIAAGSPCQGFSGLQRDKASEGSLRNISMVASVAAYIDLYRPKYAVLENVVAMAQRGRETLGVFPQLLCTLVGLGYQVAQHLLDAWSFGDAQRRSRLFVTIAAPGLAPIPLATLTHSHPPDTPSVSLSKNLANGQRFGERQFVPTPFKYVSAQESMGNLPDVQDSHIQTCITFPDHRTVSTEAAWTRMMIRHIPIFPPVQGAMSAIRTGVMPKALADRFLKGGTMRQSPKSRSWSRIPAHGLTSTITTAPAAACAINGRVLHWQQHRVLTIREARRAQGFDDGEVIIGSPNEQWKIIGNSVSRSTARALGMALQEAWFANPLEHQLSETALPISSDAGNERATDKSSGSSSSDLLPHLPQAARSQPMHQGAIVIDLTQD